MGIFHQHTGEKMVFKIMSRNTANLFRDYSISTIGSNDQFGFNSLRVAIMYKFQRRRLTGGNLEFLYTSQENSTRVQGGLIQQVTGSRVT
jgi:hypothetical protein